MADAKPYTKAAQLARGASRTWRRKAKRGDWKVLRAAKLDGRPCRICAGPWARRMPGTPPQRAAELHHIVSRAQGGDDVADNLVGLCRPHHRLVTERNAATLFLLAESLSDAEYAYVVGKLGEGGMQRLFGVDRV